MSTAGETLTALTTWATVTAAVPDTEPDVAVIVALPFAVAVATPAASTLATEASLVAHAADAPAITWPFWSRTSAVNRVVSSRAVSVAEAGLTVTVVATGAGGGGGGATAPSPQERTSSAIPATVIVQTVKPVARNPGRPSPRGHSVPSPPLRRRRLPEGLVTPARHNGGHVRRAVRPTR